MSPQDAEICSQIFMETALETAGQWMAFYPEKWKHVLVAAVASGRIEPGKALTLAGAREFFEPLTRAIQAQIIRELTDPESREPLGSVEINTAPRLRAIGLEAAERILTRWGSADAE